MTALKPFAFCAFILATATIPSYGGAMGQDQAVPNRPQPGKTIVSSPSSPTAGAMPGQGSATTSPSPSKTDPALAKSPILRGWRTPFRPLGIMAPTDGSNAPKPSDPATTSNAPLSSATASVGYPAPPANAATSTSGPIKVPSTAPTSAAPTSISSTPAAPTSISSTPAASSSASSAPAASSSASSAPAVSSSAPAASSSAPAASSGSISSSATAPAASPSTPSSPPPTSSIPSAPTTPSSATASVPVASGTASDSAATSTAVPSAASVARAAIAASQAATSAPTAVADAYVNFGAGPYADASKLTTGIAKPWYDSPVVSRLFGGTTPDAKAQSTFENKVVSTVDDTYKQSGLPIRLTTDPSVTAAHTMSVVSGAQASDNGGAIGIAGVGYNGFTFIDKFGQAQSTDALATAVGNNLAHELMHAFGVSDHPDDTGTHVDAATATWASLTDPNATFSQPAANLLSTLNFDATGDVVASGSGLQSLAEGDPASAVAVVPEPSTIALWALASTLAIALRRRS